MNDDILKQAKEAWNKPKGKQYRYGSTDYNLLDKGEGCYDIFIHASGDIKKDTEDWIRNFKAYPKRYKIAGDSFYIHAGFLESFKELIFDLMPRIKDAKEVNISGTSLGGGIAQILNVYLRLTTDIEIKSVTTFGSPKPFWGYGRGYIIALCLSAGSNHYRINSDIVPNLPPLLYKAVGTRIQIKVNNKLDRWWKYLVKPFIDHSSYWKELKNG